jgi:hypothetical protein
MHLWGLVWFASLLTSPLLLMLPAAVSTAVDRAYHSLRAWRGRKQGHYDASSSFIE